MKKFPKSLKDLTWKDFLVLGVIWAFIALIVFPAVFGADKPEEKSLSEVVTAIESKSEKNPIKEVVIIRGEGLVQLVFEDETEAIQSTEVPLDYIPNVIEKAEDANLDVRVDTEYDTSLLSTIIGLLPLIIAVALIWFLLFGMGTMNKGGGIKKTTEIPTTRFEDVAGANEALEDVQEIVDFLKDPDKFKVLGAKSPKGALLVGAPGTGKTLLARAVAGEAGVPFYAASGSDFIDMFVGTGTRRIKKLFQEANANAPAIIFIDEIDGVGSKRSGENRGGADQEQNRTVNALLTEMDGFKESAVIVLAATNNPDKLDEALVRPGRFDRKIVVDLPDWAGRLGILKLHSKGKSIDPDVSLEQIAKGTSGMSGAELSNLINEALINAGRNGRTAANQVDFMEALSVVTLGRARRSRILTDKDKRVAAVHEAGHTVVGLALDEVPDPTHVSILPRGFSGGHTKLQESEDKYETSTHLKARIAMMMGGLAAERKFFGDITQGPGHDLKAATSLAKQMITQMGMGTTYATYSDDSLTLNSNSAVQVQNEIEALVSSGVVQAEGIIRDPRWAKVIETIVDELLEKDSLESGDLQRIKNSFLE